MGSSATVLVVAVAWLWLVAASVPLHERDKPRSIRGFKSHALSTARGFGKRAEPEVEPDAAEEDALPSIDRLGVFSTDANSLPADWFADELQGNAALARLVVRKFLDSNSDGLLTADELLRPISTDDQQTQHYRRQ